MFGPEETENLKLRIQKHSVKLKTCESHPRLWTLGFTFSACLCRNPDEIGELRAPSCIQGVFLAST